MLKQMTEKKKRNLKLDNMKFLLIFLVVLGHISEKYTADYSGFKIIFLIIYVFHMPAFLFISGLLSKGTVDRRKYRNIFSYLMLYFVIKIVRNGVNYVINGSGSFSILSESGLAWYAGALFAYCLITVFLKSADKRWVLICSVILGCFAGYDSNLGDFLILSRIIVYYPFFLLGYMTDTDKLMKTAGKVSVKVVSAVGVGVFVALFAIYGEELYWIRPLLTGRNPFSELEYYSSYGLVLRFVYYIAVIAIILMLIALVPNIKVPMLTGIGSRSIAVYTFHFCFIDVIWGIFGFGEWMRFSAEGISFYLGMTAMAAAITLVASLPVFVRLIKFLTTPRLKAERRFIDE